MCAFAISGAEQIAGFLLDWGQTVFGDHSGVTLRTNKAVEICGTLVKFPFRNVVVKLAVVLVNVGVDSVKRGPLFFVGFVVANFGVKTAELFDGPAAGVVCRPDFFVVTSHDNSF